MHRLLGPCVVGLQGHPRQPRVAGADWRAALLPCGGEGGGVTLVARPTTYKGIEMRSRLEATVAANLDLWGYDWEYEPRAYAAGRVQYLPDFVLKVDGRLASVLEVKGADPGDTRQVFDQMSVIWRSEPTAFLVLVVAEWIASGAWSKSGAPRASFMVMLPDIPEKIYAGAYVLCPCGTVGLRLTFRDGFALYCRGCGEAPDPVAYLDITERRA